MIKIVESSEEMRRLVKGFKNEAKRIGFVPTMGALHEGHQSLVERAVAENDVCVVSIFVNPTQFNNHEDLEKYPRTLTHDIALLKEIGCSVVFAPQVDEMYSETEINSLFDFDFGGLDRVMEGKFRPGHFNGVVQIVSKLFALLEPDRAYFGEKDFQQLAIIHRMVEVMGLKVEIVDCPIVRETSGLAMSSRNERLSAEQRQNAAGISKVLFECATFAGPESPQELAARITEAINKQPDLSVEYVEVVDAKSLQPVNSWATPTVVCVAVFCGDVRLIDNVKIAPR